MRSTAPGALRIAVVGGGPAGCFFALSALQYARLVGRDLSITIYEGRDFRRFGQPGCNMCAGIVPVSVLGQFSELGLSVPPELVLSRIRSYALHTSAGRLDATQPDPGAEIISVYRGAGPRYGHPQRLIGFDELLLEETLARGACCRRTFVEAVRFDHGPEVLDDGEWRRFDLVVLASGVNGQLPTLHGLSYRPPPTGTMCQTELYLGEEAVEHRLGSAVHIFLPPDSIARYGILVPKGPFVTVSLLGARTGMRSQREFLALSEVRALLGAHRQPVCGCLPRIAVGPAAGVAADGFVAIGDASATRLYKNGIGSALATARRAAWTAVHRGCSEEAFRSAYLPLCRAIHGDNRIGRILFLEVPALKHFPGLARAHHRLAVEGLPADRASELQTRILWGMFTGAYSYRELFQMALNPRLLARVALALAATIGEHGLPLGSRAGPAPVGPQPPAGSPSEEIAGQGVEGV